MDKQTTDIVPVRPHTHGDSVHTATKYIAAALAVVVVGGGGFFAGTQYANAHQTNQANAAGVGGGFGDQNGQSGFGSSGRMGRMGSFGTVTAASSTSITISVTQGPPDQQDSSSSSSTSKTYAITSSTKITNNGSTVTAGSIATGDTVMIRADSSNSETAASILVNPSFGGAGGRMQSSTNTDNTTDSGESST